MFVREKLRTNTSYVTAAVACGVKREYKLRSYYSKTITTPHIPLSISTEEAMEILRNVSSDIEVEENEDDTFYRTAGKGFQFGFHEKNGKVSSTWYNDPSGRKTGLGRKKKISLYLQRYGVNKNWEKGINNGWIQFFINEQEGVGMSYGIDMDVIRFNAFSNESA